MAGDVLVPLEHHHVGLCLATESNLRREWPLIGQTIQNRVRSNRYPDTWIEVILQRSQFSAFNEFTKNTRLSPASIFDLVARRVTKDPGGPLLLAYAIDMAARMVEADAEGQRISDLISPQTFHYWSPVSMVPKGRQPAWAPQASRIYTPDGFDPERFRFAENVP